MNANPRHISVVVYLLLIGVLAVGGGKAAGQVIYSNDFSGGAGPEWSTGTVSTTPIGGRRYLGEFGNANLSLTLSALLAHSEITVAFDLFILRTMDGNGDTDQDPRNLWKFFVAGGPTLVNATFMNSFLVMKNSVQSYPDNYGVGVHEGRTGAAENNTLGVTWNYWPLDSVYHLAYTFPHASESLVLGFTGTGHQELADESWGLANVVVSAGPVKPIITLGPENRYAAVGESTLFSFRAAGGLELKYQWFHEGKPLSGQTNASLALNSIQATNAGAYTVEVTSGAGTTVSRPASLTVFPTRPPVLWEFAATSAICAPPALGRDGTVYVGSGGGTLYAIDSSGSNAWSATVGGPIAGSPAVGPSGRIYFGARDSSVWCLNANGRLVRSYSTGGFADASPAMGADETLYVGDSGGSFHAFRPSGGSAWSRSTSGWIESSAAISRDGVIYVGSAAGWLYAWNALGQQLWSCRCNGPINSSPAIGSDGTIYVGTSGKSLHAISPLGTNLWSFGTGGPVESSPAVGPDDTIYFGSGDQKLYAVNPDGTEKWQFFAGGPVGSSPAVGADGTIFFGPVGGNVFALSPSGTVKWVMAVGPAVFGASPLLTLDGRLYVCGNQRVYALDAGTPLSTSAWPMFRRDPHHTGNAGLPFAFPGILSAVQVSVPGGSRFDLYAEIGLKYEIYASSDLKTWVPLTNVVPTSLHTEVADPDAINYRQRFYRAVGP
jgi:outer membrane protein assembly factor BamB